MIDETFGSDKGGLPHGVSGGGSSNYGSSHSARKKVDGEVNSWDLERVNKIK